MRPAFSSPRQALAFALFVAALLALPAVVGQTGWLAGRNVYPGIRSKYGPFPWIQQKIFTETGDADMVFLGSSRIWNAIDTPYVQKRLSEQLGREAEVFTLAWPWPGFDASYIIGRDLLAHRRVRTLVIYDEAGATSTPHLVSSDWFRIEGDPEVFAGLPWEGKVSLYSAAVLGMPRCLLSLARPDLLDDPRHGRPTYWNTRYRAPNVAEQRGALKARLAYYYSPDYVPWEPLGEAAPSDAVIYSARTRDQFQFTGTALEPYQLHFARALARLCRDRGTRLVVLHMPTLTEPRQDVVAERQFWPVALGAPADMVGISPARLFAGIGLADVPRLFYDDVHMNQSGQEMFTPLITPALVQLHAKSRL